jgi:hypothetical protein
MSVSATLPDGTLVPVNWPAGFLPTHAVAPLNQGVTTYSATIANGASLSGAIDLAGNRLSAIIMPAIWTAAGLSFQVSADGMNYFNIKDNSSDAEVTWTVSASGYYTSDDFLRWKDIRYLKIRSGTAASAVAQGADRIITIVGAP